MRRLQVSRLFFSEEITKAREGDVPSRSDPRWDTSKPIGDGICHLCWVKTPNQVKLAFYFSKSPYWCEIDEGVIKGIEAYIIIE